MENVLNLSVDFCLNPAYDENKNPIFVLKICGADYWELNIQLDLPELELFHKVKDARWDERTSVKIGKCLKHPTFWSCENQILSILIGGDDEIWQFGVSMNKVLIDDLLIETEKALNSFKLKDNKWLLA